VIQQYAEQARAADAREDARGRRSGVELSRYAATLFVLPFWLFALPAFHQR
jgi:hypothetical protein